MPGKATRKPKRFLFVFSDTGGGHRAAAQAVRDAMKHLYGEMAYVEMVDIMVETKRWPFDRFPRWYPDMVKLNGVPWGVGFHASDHLTLVKTVSRLVWPYTKPAMLRLMQHYPSDIVVSFYAVPNYVLSMSLERANHIPLVIVALDLVDVHAAWFTPGAARYLVPTELAKQRAQRWGVSEEQITVTGMPARPQFHAALNIPREEARARLGLSQDRPVVLMMGGGDGMGPLAKIVRAAATEIHDAQLVAITGRNQALYEALQSLSPTVRIEGFVSNPELWMRAADILVTKAGPNTLAESFIHGLPVILYAALPGQESGNVDFVVENHAGMWAPRPDLAINAIQSLLQDANLRHTMAARAKALARPRAAEHVAREIWKVAQFSTQKEKQHG